MSADRPLPRVEVFGLVQYDFAHSHRHVADHDMVTMTVAGIQRHEHVG